ncbi:SDR family oxidoreductase [Aliiglaciecola litoralis]|uniref:SDR family oxidoreductase n=1 Tax=Aliiglaciecola litoralis TaxID=582857 RepID=A0ABP3WS97_9ALTE
MNDTKSNPNPKHILITGAGSGLGKALALSLAGPGTSLCLIDQNKEAVQKVAETLAKSGCDTWFERCDITSEEDIAQLKSTLQSRWGKVDRLINNAGVATGGALQYEDIEQWQWVLNINLLGLVRMTKALVPLMSAGASIINIASQAGITPIPMMASYNASKAAVVSFSETMHLELAPNGIHVCVACPSFFPTNLDKSLRSKQPGIEKLVSKMLSRSDIDAHEVARIIIQQADAKKFMIVTHKQGKTAYALKRFLPQGYYLAMIKRKTRHFGRIKES